MPCRALAKSCGGECHVSSNPDKHDGPIAVWGQIRGARELLNGRSEFYRLDHAYVGRNEFFRITKNDFQPLEVKERPTDRWDALKARFSLEIEPWQKGGHIVLAVSMPGTYDFFNVAGWSKGVQKELEKTGRKVIVRQRKETRPIKEDLRGAHALVTFASNSVIDSLLAGVPVFVAGPSIARQVAGKWGDFENPVYPDRERFLRHMAYCQFKLEEFKSGFALRTAEENWATEMHSSLVG